MKSEQRYYFFAAICFIAALYITLNNQKLSVAFVALTFSIGSATYGRRLETTLQEKQSIIEDLIQDKQSLRRNASKTRTKLQSERERKAELQEEKKRENRRLSNLKRALKRKGIDTDYLLEKYDESLYAPLMVLTHFSAPHNNSKEDHKFISANLDALDTKMLHGSARIVPPRNFDQSIRTKKELQDWFDSEVLGDRDDLAHKLEVISIVDITKTFDRDASPPTDGPDFKTHTVSELFETDTVLPTEDLLELLSRSDRISLEEELQENIALLVVHDASETQMEQLIEAQTELEAALGDLTQISNTPIDDIAKAFEQAGINEPKQLATAAKDEATRLHDVIND